MDRIIGIDLGTSTSEAAVLVNGKPVMIPGLDGELILPSVVGVDENGAFQVGQDAWDQALLYPERTAVEIKRKMGSREKVTLGDKTFTPQEISAQILIHIKEYAQEFLKQPVERAVITVPAYFNNQQRNATIQAGELAGLKVERIINEPTAAALNYGIDHMEDESHILVYDLGGGTFDVTLLEMFSGVLEVKASSGNNQLGGKDFDERIIQFLIKKCRDKHGVDLSKDAYAMVKLKDAAMKCKIALSTEKSYEILLPMIAEKNKRPISIRETITVQMFEEMIMGLVEKTRDSINVVLKDSNLSKGQIDLVLLVGGSTRIPCVRMFVEDVLKQKPRELLDPDLAIALGAAVQGGILSGELDAETDIMLTDVAPYALGVRVAAETEFGFSNDCMDIIIPRNITIPVTRKQQYTTLTNNQSSCDIVIYQGTREVATENHFLGEFTLSGIPSGKRGKEKIDVEFTYDQNGILHVKAVVVSTGKDASIAITLTETKHTGTDISQWRLSPYAKKFRSTIRKTENMIDAGDIEIEDWDELDDLLYEIKEALVNNYELAEIENIEERILYILERY